MANLSYRLRTKRFNTPHLQGEYCHAVTAHRSISTTLFARSQRGQAMVEYAILLILMVTLIMGGLELSVTAYHSKKTGDAAEAGANSWAEAISFSKANPTNATEQTTEEFEQLLEREREGLNIDTFLNEDDGGFSYDDSTYYNDRHCGSLPVPETDPCIRLLDTAGHDIADLAPSTADPDDDEIRPFLPLGCTLSTLPANYRANFNPDLPIDITACDQTQAGYEDNIRLLLSDADSTITDELFPLTQYRELDPYQDFIEICTSRNNADGIEKIVTCRHLVDNDSDIYDYDTPTADGIQDNCITPLVPPATNCADGVLDNRNVKDGKDDSDPTFRRLLVLKDLKNSVKYNNVTSASTPTQQGLLVRKGLGDHNPTNFVRPFCNPLGASAAANDYDNGLPDATSIYLFNPLPIDISNCTGDDPFRLNRSRMSILMGGYKDPAPDATTDAANNPAGDQSVEGMPQVNQAMVSQYVKVCAIDNAGQISIATTTGPGGGTTLVGLDNCSANGGSIWLKPPGKMCGAAGGGEICPDDNGVAANLNGATGYYFFGVGNEAGRGEFAWRNDSLANLASIAETFRPTFQIVCGDLDDNAHQSGATDPNGDCAASTGSFALEVHTRYRSIFESFLTMGLQELPASAINLANYFYNPSGAGNDGTVLVGALGSELGPLGKNGRPSVKQYKDFRGCYRVDISPPDKIGEQVKTAVSSCN